VSIAAGRWLSWHEYSPQPLGIADLVRTPFNDLYQLAKTGGKKAVERAIAGGGNDTEKPKRTVSMAMLMGQERSLLERIAAHLDFTAGEWEELRELVGKLG
jgi:hypothetical protein